MELDIRKADENDFYQTEVLTRETFWNLYAPGCAEHLVLHNLRKSECYVNELDMLAIYRSKIVGHIISTKAIVVDNLKEHEVLCVGPFAVDNALQNKGIGTDLFNKSITVAKEMNFGAMILFGNPNYYQRFGFRNAKDFEITTKDGFNFDAFMVLELHPNRLSDVHGFFFEDKAFNINEEELTEFEKQFPFKQKCSAKIDIKKM